MYSRMIAVFLLLWSATCFGQTFDFTGAYECKGFDPYLNKAYSGKLYVVPYNSIYNVFMQYDTGEKAIGTAGLWDNETLAVVFQDVNDEKVIGLERYSYTKDRQKIQGYWVYLKKDKLGKEICEKKSKTVPAKIDW